MRPADAAGCIVTASRDTPSNVTWLRPTDPLAEVRIVALSLEVAARLAARRLVGTQRAEILDAIADGAAQCLSSLTDAAQQDLARERASTAGGSRFPDVERRQ